MLTAILLLSAGLIFGVFVSHVQYFIFKVTKDLSVIGRQKGYHIHHSMFGVVFYFIPQFVHMSQGNMLLLYGFATGIIVDHTMKEGFIFITKESNDGLNYWFLSRHFLLLMLPELELEFVYNWDKSPLSLLDNSFTL